MSKVQIVRDYYKSINGGNHDEAEAYLHENFKTTYRGTSGTYTYHKTEATKGLKEAHKAAQTEVSSQLSVIYIGTFTKCFFIIIISAAI